MKHTHTSASSDAGRDVQGHTSSDSPITARPQSSIYPVVVPFLCRALAFTEYGLLLSLSTSHRRDMPLSRYQNMSSRHASTARCSGAEIDSDLDQSILGKSLTELCVDLHALLCMYTVQYLIERV